MSKIIVTTEDQLSLLIENSVKQAFKGQSAEMQTTERNLLDIDQASEYLKLAKQTVYGFTSKNEIPYIKRGKKLYFRKTELETWLNEGRRKTNKEIEIEVSSKAA